MKVSEKVLQKEENSNQRKIDATEKDMQEIFGEDFRDFIFEFPVFGAYTQLLVFEEENKLYFCVVDTGTEYEVKRVGSFYTTDIKKSTPYCIRRFGDTFVNPIESVAINFFEENLSLLRTRYDEGRNEDFLHDCDINEWVLNHQSIRLRRLF